MKNVLIVEDDEAWWGNYTRAAKAVGIESTRIAPNLATATALIDDMQFALAFVDIGLNVADDDNTDGVDVMQKIRGLGDRTSIVVVTGRASPDVLKIARNALKEYDALDIIAKPEIEPEDIRRLIREGLETFAEKSAGEQSAHDALRGTLDKTYWEDQMLRGTGVQDGVQGLHHFLDGLLGEFLPILPQNGGDMIGVDDATGIADGAYWSRAIGQPIVIVYGKRTLASEEIEAAKSSGSLLGRYHVEPVLKRSAEHGLGGAVFGLADMPRDAFGISDGASLKSAGG
ncbi:MAG TPA: response regulator [Acidimicrobiales bacterium]